MTAQQWRRRLYHLQAKLVERERRLEQLKSKESNRITDTWLVHAGLSDPNCSVRAALSDLFCAFVLFGRPCEGGP